MSRQQQFRVVDSNGVKGTLLTTSRFLDDNPHRLVRLQDGRELLVPKSLLGPQDDGSILLTAPIPQLLCDIHKEKPPTQKTKKPKDQKELDVERRAVESGRIRVNK